MIRLHVEGTVPADVIDRVKLIADLHPGEHRLAIRVVRPSRIDPSGRVPGEDVTTITLGDQWMAEASMECVARLEDFGGVEVVEND